jgi:hypothetical protein
MISTSLYEAYVFEFLLGFAFAGRVIVGLNYILEYNLPKNYDSIVFAVLISLNMSCIIYTAWFQFIDRGWFLM